MWRFLYLQATFILLLLLRRWPHHHPQSGHVCKIPLIPCHPVWPLWTLWWWWWWQKRKRELQDTYLGLFLRPKYWGTEQDIMARRCFGGLWNVPLLAITDQRSHSKFIRGNFLLVFPFRSPLQLISSTLRQISSNTNLTLLPWELSSQSLRRIKAFSRFSYLALYEMMPFPQQELSGFFLDPQGDNLSTYRWVHISLAPFFG